MILRRKDGTITPKWNHNPTVAIRIPEVFKSQILEYAKALDSNEKVSAKEAFKLIDAYLKKNFDEGPAASRKNSSPRWYFFNKFRNWVIGE